MKKNIYFEYGLFKNKEWVRFKSVEAGTDESTIMIGVQPSYVIGM